MFSLFRENVRIAMDSIRSQLLRTILTVVIIGIGIWALVGILAAVKALENTISSDFASMGANSFNIQRYDFTSQGRRGGERQKINPIISYRDIKEFQDAYNYPFTRTSVSFRGTSRAEVRYEGNKTDPEVQVYGVNENYLNNTGTEVEKGRDFNVFDIQNNVNVCLLGADFKKTLFEGTDPIGKTLSIRGVKFKVIGLLESKGATFGNNQDLKVLIPIQQARSIYTAPNITYTISVMVDDKEYLEGAQSDAIVTFRNVRGLSPVEENNFGLERSEDLINRIAEITGVLEFAAWFISAITIFGSLIALMNIMLVSVTERTREIGVRKALGAKRSTIGTQFLMETVVIGQLGSILGILLGLGTGLAFAKLADFNFSIPWGAVIAATIITFLVAVVAGSYPAMKAARLDPIESLRYE
ncbi:ABC transporter permease [Gilvibacter sp.]|uniref:ABC transporter permease n=1 Tax=Gilvibacter sp. TaxID=2729997 RepID=UPI0025C6B34F|nr:ABC transporter permease [Gilvibacter sp.]NQX77623.1 ABC transporter permease [Gilvibacter sp.]